MFSLGRVSTREAGDLRRYHAHCDVIVINVVRYEILANQRVCMLQMCRRWLHDRLSS